MDETCVPMRLSQVLDVGRQIVQPGYDVSPSSETYAAIV